jgi:AraC family transcriptional regulator
LFRETTGESPHQFVLRQRISHAKFLLSSPDLSIAQIAVECGFANSGHLTQTFKRYVGLTPSEYRNFN